jgi:hypothetical protein
MPPASRPARSCDLPSVADTLSASCAVKLSGRAPYFSWLASFFAEPCVKLPLIWVVWPLIAVRLAGAEMTSPSSTNPTYTAHDVAVELHCNAEGTWAFELPRLCLDV